MPNGARARGANGPGKGDGWGGQARGVGIPDKAPRFAPGNQASVGHAGHNLSNAEKAQALKDHLYRLATTAEREETQVQAAKAFLDRIEGAPVARNVTFNTDDVSALDDDALTARREALERAVGAGVAGAASPTSAPRSDEFRH